MSELNGQQTMMDYITPAPDTPMEGYDENGHLMDYIPERKGTAENGTPDASKPSTSNLQPSATSPRTPEIIAAEINAIKRQAMAVAISAALEIGEKLVEARNLVPRGRWTEWLAANVDYSERKAQDLMRFFEAYGDRLPDAVARLDYTKALQLLALPEPEREAMAERVEAEQLSTRQLEAEIKRLRESHAQAQQTIFNLSQEAETAQRDLQREREAAYDAEQRAQAARQEMEGWKAVSSKASQEAANSTAQYADAVQRANTAQRKLDEAEARIRQLEAEGTQQVTEVQMPDAEAKRQIEALRAEIERLKAEPAAPDPAPDPDAEADKRRMALALRVRMAAQDCAGALNGAINAATAKARAISATLEQLRALDHRRAAALTDEVWALQALAEACDNAVKVYISKVPQK